MIRAYLNSNELTLFPETPIGITIENFNISDMTNRKIDRTNVIRVPKVGNELAFEFSAIPNAPTDFVYNDYDFDMIVDGIMIYENGRAFITGEDDDSYTLNVTNNKNIIDLLKSIKLADLYTGDTIVVTTTAGWEELFIQETNGFKIDFLFDPEIVPTSEEYVALTGNSYLSIYLDTILTKIEADYSITFSGDLLTDADYLEMRIPCVSSNIKRDNGSGTVDIIQLIIHDSLTAWGLIKNIIQLTCSVFKIDGTDMELQKFNDLDITTPVDWSGKLVSKSKKFAIPDTAQQNYIKHSIASEVDKNQDSVLIESNNTNIDYEKDLVTMKDKLFPFRDMQDYYSNASTLPLLGIAMPELAVAFPSSASPNMERVKGLKDLVILVDSAEYLGQPLRIYLAYRNETDPGLWNIHYELYDTTTDADTTLVKYYDPTANYSLIATMLTDPVFYEAELNLNIVDIHEFDHFKAIRIDELEGIFYVNKITDFLATSPGTPTKVELIKIS